MANRFKGPSWFKLWLHHKPLIDAVADDVAGRALKAAMLYFTTGEVVQLEQLEALVFAAIKADIDKANDDYQRDVENGKKGGRPRKEKEKPPVTEGKSPPGGSTEGEGERDGEREKEGEADQRDIQGGKPPSHPHFSPPNADDVKTYCREQGFGIDAEGFVDHYESNGWMVGRNKMKDWKAAVRNWRRKDKAKNGNNGKAGSEQIWSSIGTTV